MGLLKPRVQTIRWALRGPGRLRPTGRPSGHDARRRCGSGRRALVRESPRNRGSQPPKRPRPPGINKRAASTVAHPRLGGLPPLALSRPLKRIRRRTIAQLDNESRVIHPGYSHLRTVDGAGKGVWMLSGLGHRTRAYHQFFKPHYAPHPRFVKGITSRPREFVWGHGDTPCPLTPSTNHRSRSGGTMRSARAAGRGLEDRAPA